MLDRAVHPAVGGVRLLQVHDREVGARPFGMSQLKKALRRVCVCVRARACVCVWGGGVGSGGRDGSRRVRGPGQGVVSGGAQVALQARRAGIAGAQACGVDRSALP